MSQQTTMFVKQLLNSNNVGTQQTFLFVLLAITIKYIL
jgi:hypothetical protein